jgi:Uma2 family endonuclease
MPVTTQTRPGSEMSAEKYERFAVGTGGKGWELVDGRLRERPLMTIGHGHAAFELSYALWRQLDHEEFRVGHNFPRLKHGERTYLIPDVVVHHARLPDGAEPDPWALDLQISPVLLVVEVICPYAASHYDFEGKIRDYRARGDREVWRLDPFERTLVAWRIRPDGSCSGDTLLGGPVAPIATPEVTVNLGDYFV